MKILLLLALLAGATAVEAAPASVNQDQQPPSKKEVKKIRKARQQKGPEVYKGTVAEQNRIVTDAPGAEKEDNDGTSKKERKGKKN